MRSARHDWLRGLKVGDTVILESIGSSVRRRIAKVERSGARSVWVEGMRFGRRVGAARRDPGGYPTNIKIHEPFPERVEAIEAGEAQGEIQRLFDHPKIPPRVWLEILSTLKGHL